jgi:hypothetical protein
MTNGRELDQPATYEIRFKGDLDPKWLDWFDEFVITPQQGSETWLTGTVADQAALYGILLKLHSLGLPLLSVKRCRS